MEQAIRIGRRNGVLIVFVLLVAFMVVSTSTFGTYQNLINVLQQNFDHRDHRLRYDFCD